MADFNRVATTSTSYRLLGYTTLFFNYESFFFFFFSFSERQGDNLQLWISSNCKLAAYHLMNIYCPHLEYDF